MSAVNLEISPVKLSRARGTRSRAAVARAVGTTRQHIWQIESGLIVPRGDLLARLCLLYGVDIGDLTRTPTNGKKKVAA